MKDSNITIFDKEDFCKEHIHERIAELRKICRANDIPFAIVLCEKSTEKETKYFMDGAFTGSMDIHLVDDKMIDFLKIQNGFKAYPERTDFISQEDLDYIQDFSIDEEL